MDIAFQSIRKKNQLFKLPFLLTEKDEDTIDQAIQYFESIVGLSEEEFDNKFIINLFSKRKIGRGLITVLSRWFYNIQGLETLHKIPPRKWRYRLYEEFQSQNVTWIPSSKKNQFLQKFGENWNIDVEITGQAGLVDLSIEQYLFGDHKKNYKITSRGDTPISKDVILRFNTEVIGYLFSRAISVSFVLSNVNLTGTLIKKLIVSAKRWGIYANVTQIKSGSSGSVLFEVIGPNELVGKGTKYGKQLYALFYLILPELYEEDLELIFDINYYNRFFKVLLPLSRIPTLLPINQAFSKNFSSPYDSTVEEEFARQFKSRFPQWQIERELVIIEGDIIFIPDFKLKYRNIEVILEIIGFWTEQYLQKKIKKIKYFKPILDNLIVLVDSKLNFPQLGVETFYYQKTFPFAEIKKYLEVNHEHLSFKQHIVALNDQKEKISNDIKHILEKSPICDNICLSKILETRSPQETRQACEILLPDIVNNVNCLVLLHDILLFDITFLHNLQDELSQLIPATGINEEVVEEHFKHIKTSVLNSILIYFGYIIDYGTLMDMTIHPPKENKIISPDIV